MKKTSYKPIKENPQNKPFLLIGTFNNDKIVNEIHLAGMTAISKNLTSSPDNWDRINDYIEKNQTTLSCVALSLSESVLLISRCNSYKDKFQRMLNLLQNIPHIIFVYEDNRFSKFNIFNTRYYKKYLFYDDFFVNREIFKKITSEYDEYRKDIRENLSTQYFYDTLMPATFLAEENEWNLLKKQHLFYLDDMRQLSIFDCIEMDAEKNEDECWANSEKSKIIQEFVDALRSELSLTDVERRKFLRMNGDERMQFIDSKCAEIRKRYSSSIKDSPLNLDVIKKLFNSDEFKNSIFNDDNWKEREWKLFEIYLREKHICEDEEIKKACDSMQELIQKIYSSELNVLTYKYSNDIVRFIRDFIENKDESVVFRSYILKDRIWANELESFLSLFQEYVTKIRGVNISFEQRKTDIGIIYVILSSNKEIVKSEFPQYVYEFSHFLEYCDKNISKAREVLTSYGLSENEISKYIFKFQKSARRLMSDIRQEYELKMLECRHAIENEALENKISADQYLILNDGTQKPLSLVPTVVFDDVNMFNLNEITKPIILGHYSYNVLDTQLLECFKTYSNEKDELEIELKILKDDKISRDEKVTAYGKIKTFLSYYALDIGVNDFKKLNDYIEGLL